LQPERARAVEPTQAEAIERAIQINNGGPVLIERVRNTDAGHRDKWRKPLRPVVPLIAGIATTRHTEIWGPAKEVAENTERRRYRAQASVPGNRALGETSNLATTASLQGTAGVFNEGATGTSGFTGLTQAVASSFHHSFTIRLH